ncbi:MAG: hypothetical protein QOI78_9379 [Actinomycetota bacterium]|nr:hypothetical protein [Actinomycetota bacterium]
MNQLAADVGGREDDRPPVVLLHGLTYERRQWAPLVARLGDRRTMALDLPGHGESPRGSYALADVTAAIHETVTAAGLRHPVLIGHSLGGVVATCYAARYPARAVVNLDQPLLAGPFGELLRQREEVLRGPDYLSVWEELRAGMGIDDLPEDTRRLLRSTPRQDLFLGYWHEILADDPAELRARRTGELSALQSAGAGYHHVSRAELPAPYRDWLLSAVPGAEFTVLAGSGHFPHLSRPEAVAEIAARWE